ncbi:MAG: hypothetical protein QQN41_12995, partial [Nitrosopumilus sp.]
LKKLFIADGCKGLRLEGICFRRQKMIGLDKAKKKFWYDSNFDKQDNHLEHHLDLLTFTQGWKAALDCVKGRIDYGNASNDMVDWIFEEELDAKT